MTNPMNCSTCDYKYLNDNHELHCYMFKDEPTGICNYHKPKQPVFFFPKFPIPNIPIPELTEEVMETAREAMRDFLRNHAMFKVV